VSDCLDCKLSSLRICERHMRESDLFAPSEDEREVERLRGVITTGNADHPEGARGARGDPPREGDRSRGVDGGGAAPRPPAGGTALIRFEVPGIPKPKARPRVVRSKHTGKVHAFTPEETLRFERLVAMCARTAGARPVAGRVVLQLGFYLPKLTRRSDDVDNLCKSVLDGLNGVAFEDDSQVDHLFASRYVDPANPRTVVRVETVDEMTARRAP
jgi:crossover junction endodeoxyribonuclease RusA